MYVFSIFTIHNSLIVNSFFSKLYTLNGSLHSAYVCFFLFFLISFFFTWDEEIFLRPWHSPGETFRFRVWHDSISEDSSSLDRSNEWISDWISASVSSETLQFSLFNVEKSSKQCPDLSYFWQIIIYYFSVKHQLIPFKYIKHITYSRSNRFE